jgi:subtilisin-like proprotein convertase family protein
VPPIQPGRYWIGVFNPNDPNTDPNQTFSLFATILPPNPAGSPTDFVSAGSTPLLDDAVTNSEIFVATNLPVVSVNVGIVLQDPRISDLALYLISPSGTRVDLMENRGGTTTNGAGAMIFTTNSVNVTANGTAQPDTNYLNVGESSGTLAITYNFYTAPDEMTIYYGMNTDPANLIYDTGVTNNPPASGPPNPTNTIPVTFTLNFGPTNGIVSTYLTIVMDQFLSTNRSDAWTYTAGGVSTNYAYLTFTEDTNLTTTPIKFAVPPFVPVVQYFTNIQTNIVFSTNSTTSIVSDFESPSAGEYLAASAVDGWNVVSNQVSVVNDPLNAQAGNQFLALASGSISRTLPTVAGVTNILKFAYRGPGIVSMWRGEGNALDYIDGNNGIISATTNYTTVWTNGFEGGGPGNYSAAAGTYFAGGWYVEGAGYIDVLGNGTFGSTAYQGNYYIDLNGVSPCGISTNIATVAGITYTLNFAYARNPDSINLGVIPQAGVVVNGNTLVILTANQANSWINLGWQTTSYVFTATSSLTHLAFISTNTPGASDVLLDAVGLTTNVVNGTVTYTNGEVGKAFQYDGASSSITVPASTSLAISNLTLEAWIFPTDLNTQRPIFDYGGAGQYTSISLWLNTQDGLSLNPAGLHAIVRGQTPLTIPFLEVDTANPTVNLNQWNHVVFTDNLITRTGVLYCNGVAVSTSIAYGSGLVIPIFPEPVNLGYRNSGSLEALAGRHFQGNLDEASIYNRPLSASEIKAIYNLGSAGKFDAKASSPQNLAEAKVSLAGQTPITINGSNNTWQTNTIAFLATTNATALQIDGLEPGMLLDSAALTSFTAITNTVTNIVAVVSNLYYLPEQSLDAVTGEGAYGNWQLEIQDDRAGAGLTNSLVSWNLQFVFANTNAIPAVVGGGIGQTNQFIVPGGIAWYQVNVPTNANYATNWLLFASAPVNVWFDTNNPPTTNILLLNGTIGSKLLSTTTAANLQPPPNIYEGRTYYLGVQNPNAATVNYGVEVDFDHGNSTNSTLPQLKFSGITASGGGTSLKWTASPTAQFQVQWTDNLSQPWNTDTSIITSEDGNFTFTDDGSQTAPLGVMRFYRLVQISP